MKTVAELYDMTPNMEVDDYVAGFMMVSAISGAVPELKAQYLAQWAARLRTYYVEIGREVERNRIPRGD